MTDYSRFAEYYDVLTKNICYKERAAYFNTLIERFGGKSGGILLDLACGTGSLSEEFTKLGYDVIGVDNSQEMLSVALEKKLDSDLPIQYLHQNMTKLDMFGTIDITICALDSLNHLPNLDAVKATAERVSLFTNPGGLFIFDVNTPYKHEKVLANNTFVYDTNEVYCVWQNTYFEENCRVEINMDFFERKGELYSRSEENFSEVAFPTEQLDAVLEEAGFEVLAHYDLDTTNAPKKGTEKIVYLCRKRS